jgi:hypothetical protein
MLIRLLFALIAEKIITAIRKSKQEEKNIAINRGSFCCKAQSHRPKKAPKHLEEKRSRFKVTLSHWKLLGK